MPTFVYNKAKHNIAVAQLNLATADLRMLLLRAVTTADPDHAFVANVLGTNATEADATNYVRKTLAGEAVAQNNTNDRAEATFTSPTWAALGGAVNNTIVAAVLFAFVGTGADATENYPVSFFDIPDTATNGGDFTLTVGATGAIHIT